MYIYIYIYIYIYMPVHEANASVLHTNDMMGTSGMGTTSGSAGSTSTKRLYS